jgi:hypothetical protein
LEVTLKISHPIKSYLSGHENSSESVDIESLDINHRMKIKEWEVWNIPFDSKKT